MKDGLLEKITAVGHWRVNIRPNIGLDEPLRMQDCIKAVEAASVQLRGWDFPHISNREDEFQGSGLYDNYAEQWCDWYKHVEFWRMYQSSQFMFYKALREDMDPEGQERLDGPALSVLGVTWTLTEYVEFAFRLFTGALYPGGFDIVAELKNTANRQLWVSEFNRMPFSYPRRTAAANISLKRSVRPVDLEGGSADVSRSMILELFDKFGWNPGDAHISSDQQKLFRREF